MNCLKRILYRRLALEVSRERKLEFAFKYLLLGRAIGRRLDKALQEIAVDIQRTSPGFLKTFVQYVCPFEYKYRLERSMRQ